MSDSEQKGQCRSEVDRSGSGGPVTNAIADAIDRLAADVAAIKAKIDAVSPEDVKHFVESEKAWVALIEERCGAAIRLRDEARAEVERLKAIVHSDAGHMAKILIENERLRAGSPPSQTAAWWLTEEERAEIKHLLLIQRHNTGWTTERHAELDRILARAGSPPVVEVPVMDELDAPARVEARAYRAAMDKAGVKWKEVGRE